MDHARLFEAPSMFAKEIVDGMARAAFVTWWAGEEERKREEDPDYEMAFGAGSELMDVAPKTSREAVVWAGALAKKFVKLNNMTLDQLYDAARKAGYREDAERFGHDLAMRAMGHGVGWDDDVRGKSLKIAHPRSEYYESISESFETVRAGGHTWKSDDEFFSGESVEEADTAPLYNTPEEAQRFLDAIKQQVKAPHVGGNVSTLGGPKNTDLLIVVSLDPRESWTNGIMENSRYARFRIEQDGTMEAFVQSSRNFPKKWRKTRAKSQADTIKKLNDWVAANTTTRESVRESIDEAVNFEIGDSAHVPSLNKTGLVMDVSGSSVTLKFPDGTTKKFAKSKIERIPSDDEFFESIDESLVESISASALQRIEKVTPEKAKEIAALLRGVSTGRAVENALSAADKIIGGYGVESISGRGDGPRSYWMGSVLAYVNMGDTYDATLCYDTRKGKFLVSSWGDWYEAYESENPDESVDADSDIFERYYDLVFEAFVAHKSGSFEEAQEIESRANPIARRLKSMSEREQAMMLRIEREAQRDANVGKPRDFDEIASLLTSNS